MSKPQTLPKKLYDSATRVCLDRLIRFRIAEMDSLTAQASEGSIDAIHDLRVTCRRLQALFKIFKAYFHKKQINKFRRSLASMISALGIVREDDVLIEHIVSNVNPTTALQHTSLGLCLSRFSVHRNVAHKEFVLLLRIINQTEAITKFVKKIDRSLIPEGDKQQPFSSILRTLVPLHFERFFAASVPVLNHPRKKEALHKLRIKGKPLRYVMELSSACFGTPYAQCYKEVKSIIELLGDIHDSDVALITLKTFREEIRQLDRTSKLSLKTVVQSGFLTRAIQSLTFQRNQMFSKLNELLNTWHVDNFQEKLAQSMQANRPGEAR